jgi:hypothetical protein
MYSKYLANIKGGDGGDFCSEVCRDGIFKLLRSPGIDFNESIPPAYVVWRAGPVPTRFLAPIDFYKIPETVF